MHAPRSRTIFPGRCGVLSRGCVHAEDDSRFVAQPYHRSWFLLLFVTPPAEPDTQLQFLQEYGVAYAHRMHDGARLKAVGAQLWHTLLHKLWSWHATCVSDTLCVGTTIRTRTWHPSPIADIGEVPREHTFVEAAEAAMAVADLWRRRVPSAHLRVAVEPSPHITALGTVFACHARRLGPRWAVGGRGGMKAAVRRHASLAHPVVHDRDTWVVVPQNAPNTKSRDADVYALHCVVPEVVGRYGTLPPLAPVYLHGSWPVPCVECAGVRDMLRCSV